MKNCTVKINNIFSKVNYFLQRFALRRRRRLRPAGRRVGRGWVRGRMATIRMLHRCREWCCGGPKILQHFSTRFCLSQKRHLCIAASLYSFCQRCHICLKHIIFSAFNSLSVSLDICSVSLHIYVNLIYRHFIVIYGLLCGFIDMFCTEATSRSISVLRPLSALSAPSSRTWRVRSSSAAPRLTPGGCFPCIQFSILHPRLHIYVPFWRSLPRPNLCGYTCR